MSQRVLMLIVSWLCFISVSEAALGASCNDTSNCTPTNETCIDDSCKCSNGYFSVSNACKSSSITVSLSTQSSNVVYGSDAILTATIASEIPLNPLKWLSGSTELVIALPKYTQNGVGPDPVTLTIKNVNFGDTGDYQVEVNNAAGITSTSNQVSLNVTGEVPTVEVSETIIQTATTVTIQCFATIQAGSPAITSIQWLLNGTNKYITDANKYSGGNVNTPSLTIKNIGSTDAGVYHCRATNLVGSTNSSQSVNLAPPSNVEVSQQPSGSIIHGSKVTFTGSYSSTPLNVKDIKWRIHSGSDFVDIDINGNIKYSGSNVTGPSPKLIINPVKFIDETSYQLVVSNGVGSASSSFLFSIENVSTAPTNFDIDEIQSRGLRINFNRPDNVNGILAAYKIVISERGNCVQQILVYGHCYTCMSTFGCQPPINYTVPDITNNDVSYTASGLNPYTQYMVKVVAINGVGEGHPVKKTIRTDEEVPLQPGQITASSIQSSSLTLAWTLSDPSPGNTTYTIYTYEGTDYVVTNFYLFIESTNVYGFDTKTLLVTGLEEYWQYKFKVTAATVKGDKTSNLSSVFRTKQAAPGKVLNLTIQRQGDDYKAAYVSWNPPAMRDHNGVLKSYLFSDNHTGTMKEEEIPVLLYARVEKKISVVPEAVYIIKVVLQNNESLESPASMQTYEAPTGPPPVTYIEPVTTKPEQHIFTENTITIDINTEYFKNNENGKQVFFGIAVCAIIKCKDKTNEITLQQDWKDLPNWDKASRDGFPLYRVTNGTFMHKVREGDLRRKRFTINESVIEFKIGEDATCPLFNANFYCNGPLSPGTSYIVIIFACTNGGCTYYQTTEPFVTKIIVEDRTTGIASIIGSGVAVTLVVAVVVIGILLWKRNRRHKECKEQTNTYADLNLDERTKVDQPYSLLEHGSRAVKNKSVSLNAFYDHVVDLLRNNRQKLTTEYYDLLQYTERAASTVASSKSNVSKNRGNIIPYDFNRVKLCSTGASDYIDASFLLDKCYILTCYPIAKTFWTFWQMVWEQSVSTIVVITEQSDARESWYFSDNEGTLRTIERIDVELLAKFKSSESVTMRKIKISRGKHSKVVNHFHVIGLEMTDLPDQILALINTITQNNVKNTGPQVVHGGCTGVDNSGVYIAVDHVVKSIVSGGNEVDVYGTARTVIKERMFSISSLEQYSAIYTCLQKYVQNSSACTNDATGTYEYLP